MRAFETRDADAWTAYVDRHRDGTFYHGLPWKQAVERCFGHRSRYLVAVRNERITGVLPMFEVRSVLAGCMLVSVPYATYGGLLTDDAASAAALFAKATGVAASIGARVLELRSIRAGVGSLPVKSTHVTFVRTLPDSPDGMAAFLPRKARAAARQARERYGLTLHAGDALLPAVWELYARSMRRLASPNYPYRFFESLAQSTPGAHWVQLVRHEGRAVAGLVTFLHRDRVMPYFIGIDERADLYGLSHYLYEENMRLAVASGYRIYDFGRSRIDNSGACNFKRLCGFEPTLLEYQTFVAPGRAAPDLSPGSPRWSAARRLWKRMPLTITRPLGGWLSKSIPG